MFDAIIFDWDGTLADTKLVVVNSFQKVLQEIGCKVSHGFLEKQMGIGARNMFKNALKAANIPFDERMVDKLVKKKIKIQMELIEKVSLFEGVVELLGDLQNKVKIGLATMSNRRVIDKLLKEKGIRKYFDYVITADDVIQPKPNPEIFINCAIKLNCQPEKCVVVEDSIFGVKAAKEAKMKCIAIPAGAYSVEELNEEEPDLIVKSINNKTEILNFLLG
ncbi:HAD family phosphatase [Candidatus Bathyarchaeota archaeon]|nr:HAD family phosphatase [Candidatus Bathyarchaeota archaeon]